MNWWTYAVEIENMRCTEHTNSNNTIKQVHTLINEPRLWVDHRTTRASTYS